MLTGGVTGGDWVSLVGKSSNRFAGIRSGVRVRSRGTAKTGPKAMVVAGSALGFGEAGPQS